MTHLYALGSGIVRIDVDDSTRAFRAASLSLTTPGGQQWVSEDLTAFQPAAGTTIRHLSEDDLRELAAFLSGIADRLADHRIGGIVSTPSRIEEDMPF